MSRCDEFLAAIFDRADAHHRRQADDRAAHHRLLEILGVIFGKRRHFLREQLHLLIGTAFEAAEALVHVREKARLGKLPIGDDVDAAIDLLAYDVAYGIGDRRLVFAFIVAGLDKALPEYFAFIISSSAWGRGRLPIWVV